MKTIFLVEDDDVDAMAVERSLRSSRLDAEVVRSKDGADALSQIENGKLGWPCVILLDLNLPKLSGFELLEKLNAMGTSRPPVFVFTTSKSPSDIHRAYSLGVSGYLAKTDNDSRPTDIGRLLESYFDYVQFPNNPSFG